MEIDIPLNTWSKKKLKTGKCATSRNTKYGSSGDTFTVDGVEYELTNVRRLELEMVANRFYIEEGMTSPDEFKKVWQGIYPLSGWTPKKMVWIHFFRKKFTNIIAKNQ